METRVKDQSKTHASHEFSKRLLKLAAAGGAAFWITDFVIAVSPITAQYQAAFSISSLPVALVEALAGGLVISFCVSFFLLRFFNRLPQHAPNGQLIFWDTRCINQVKTMFVIIANIFFIMSFEVNGHFLGISLY